MRERGREGSLVGIHMTIESQLERLNSKRQVLSLRIYSTMLQCGHELSSWYGVVECTYTENSSYNNNNNKGKERKRERKKALMMRWMMLYHDMYSTSRQPGRRRIMCLCKFPPKRKKKSPHKELTNRHPFPRTHQHSYHSRVRIPK